MAADFLIPNYKYNFQAKLYPNNSLRPAARTDPPVNLPKEPIRIWKLSPEQFDRVETRPECSDLTMAYLPATDPNADSHGPDAIRLNSLGLQTLEFFPNHAARYFHAAT